MSRLSRDIQIKEIKSMHRALNGGYPHHIKFDEIDDDEIDKMFTEMSETLYAKKAEPEEEDWRQYLSTDTVDAKNKLSSCFICG